MINLAEDKKVVPRIHMIEFVIVHEIMEGDRGVVESKAEQPKVNKALGNCNWHFGGCVWWWWFGGRVWRASLEGEVVGVVLPQFEVGIQCLGPGNAWWGVLCRDWEERKGDGNGYNGKNGKVTG